MKFFYYLALKIYEIIICFFSNFNEKARFFRNGRKNIFEKIEKNVPKSEKKIWFHCASMGEFEQALPLIEIIKKEFPEMKILLTFFSPSAYEIRKNYKNADYIFYLPLDFKKNAKKFIELTNPYLVFFIKYEFWFYYLKILKEKNIPVYLISGIFREDQIFFKNYGKWFANILRNFTHIFVQNKISLKLLEKIKIKNVTIAGDTRFDRVADIVKINKNFDLIEKFKDNKKILIAGSTWKEDEEILIKYINNTKKKLKFIIAPHEIHKENINRILKKIKISKIAYSQANEKNIKNKNVLIIDNIGMLSSIYKYGEISYVGGAFGKGLHNILEPATFGMAIFFGIKYKKFQEAIDLINLKAAFSIKNFENFEKKINEILENKNLLEESSRISKNYIIENLGGTKKILKKIAI